MTKSFRFESTEIPGLTIIHPFLAEDERGYYMKCYHSPTFERNGIYFTMHENAQLRSARGVIRGLHFQINKPQAKLIRVVRGAAFDVAVDLRFGSPTFGKWRGVYLSAQEQTQFYIPKGFAHGVMALDNDTLVCYASDDVYSPETDGGIRWDDPDIGVTWPLDQVPRPILSEKDRKLPFLREYLKEISLSSCASVKEGAESNE